MFKNSKFLLLNSLKNNPKLFFNTPKKFVASRRFNTLFDINFDNLSKMILPYGIKITSFLALLNVGLFLYANIKSKRRNREKLEGVSYSVQNLRNKDYIPLFVSLLGSYRLDDLVLETGILLTIGRTLESNHGSPFIFKMFMFSFYIGLLSSMFWVQSNYAKRDRYFVKVPHERDQGLKESLQYRFMSQHNFSMSLVYYALFKTQFKLLIPMIFIADFYVWGPYYLSGPLTGLAAGMIL